MKKEIEERKSLFEVYIDDEDDIRLATKKLEVLLQKINKKRERVVLVVTYELRPRPENQGG